MSLCRDIVVAFLTPGVDFDTIPDLRKRMDVVAVAAVAVVAAGAEDRNLLSIAGIGHGQGLAGGTYPLDYKT